MIDIGKDFDPADKKARVRFHFRLQKEATLFYRRYYRFRFSNSCHNALAGFRIAVQGGLVKLEKTSRFLGREDRADKVECSARIRPADKDLLEKLAFALRRSQAEVMRMALEWWWEAVLRAPLSIYIAARRKWHHRRVFPEQAEVRYRYDAYGREVVWRFPSCAAVHKAYELIRNHDTGFLKRGRVMHNDLSCYLRSENPPVLNR
jgi:hypothetical protein